MSEWKTGAEAVRAHNEWRRTVGLAPYPITHSTIQRVEEINARKRVIEIQEERRRARNSLNPTYGHAARRGVSSS